MKTTLKEAERKLRYYQRLVKRLKQEPYDVLHASDAKKEKSERGKVPLEPLKEKGEKRKKAIDVHTPPSLELLLAWAKSRHYQDEAFTRQWFDLMTNEFYWIHPKSGEAINHWPAFYRACYLKHKESSTKQTSYRIKRADNFHAKRL